MAGSANWWLAANQLSSTKLAENTRVDFICLDCSGRIVEASDRAGDILRQGDALFDQGGFLRARSPADNERLENLIADALPVLRGESVGAR